MVSKISERTIPKIREWQNRPLETVYPFVMMDAIYFKVRDDGHVRNSTAYVVLGVTLDRTKDILGIWIGVLNELKNRGVKDILLFCVDGLTGIKEPIMAAFPKADIQRCIIHQLRNLFKYVPYKDLKEFSRDFKNVYSAVSEEEGLANLYKIKEKWGKLYPFAFSSWESNWDVLSFFFKFPNEIRKIIYTTNAIEGLNRQFRKVTKSKSVFPSDTSLEKMLHLASVNIIKMDPALPQLGPSFESIINNVSRPY